MRVCVHVVVCMCVRACVAVCVRLYVCMCVCVSVCTHMCACACVAMDVCHCTHHHPPALLCLRSLCMRLLPSLLTLFLYHLSALLSLLLAVRTPLTPAHAPHSIANTTACTPSVVVTPACVVTAAVCPIMSAADLPVYAIVVVVCGSSSHEGGGALQHAAQPRQEGLTVSVIASS